MRILHYKRKNKMNNYEKIHNRRNWQITQVKRVSIVGASYRQALSYINELRLLNVNDILQKPIKED